MSSKTYYEQILEILPVEKEISIEDIINILNIPDYKKTYVIDGIKKGLKNNKIIMIKNPNEKRLYIGHLYKKNS